MVQERVKCGKIGNDWGWWCLEESGNVFKTWDFYVLVYPGRVVQDRVFDLRDPICGP